MAAYGLSEKAEEVQRWYGGYLIGDHQVYNPWSLTRYVQEHVKNPALPPKVYWGDPSKSAFLKDLLKKAPSGFRGELDNLLLGGTKRQSVCSDTSTQDLFASRKYLWNHLYSAGYLTSISEAAEDLIIYLTLRLPNEEVKSLLKASIQDYLEDLISSTDKEALYHALLQKDTQAFERIIQEVLFQAVTTFGDSESFYQNALISFLTKFTTYTVGSYQKAGGEGEYLLMKPKDPSSPAFVFTLRVSQKFSQMENGLRDALEELDCFRRSQIIPDKESAGLFCIGLCFCKKNCIAGFSDD